MKCVAYSVCIAMKCVAYSVCIAIKCVAYSVMYSNEVQCDAMQCASNCNTLRERERQRGGGVQRKVERLRRGSERGRRIGLKGME